MKDWERVPKMDHMFALIYEINIIKERIEPTDCGHLNTTVGVLEDRVQELRQELSENEN
jgi:hypothetical protein